MFLTSQRIMQRLAPNRAALVHGCVHKRVFVFDLFFFSMCDFDHDMREESLPKITCFSNEIAMIKI